MGAAKILQKSSDLNTYIVSPLDFLLLAIS